MANLKTTEGTTWYFSSLNFSQTSKKINNWELWIFWECHTFTSILYMVWFDCYWKILLINILIDDDTFHNFWIWWILQPDTRKVFWVFGSALDLSSLSVTLIFCYCLCLHCSLYKEETQEHTVDESYSTKQYTRSLLPTC